MNERIRLLGLADVPALMVLKDAAGWNQTPRDWANVMMLSPAGCFGLEADGQIVASGTAVCYGRDLAWIGMVLTHPKCRGRGYARRLMELCLEWLEGEGIAWIKLDASDMGYPLYRKLGFQDEGPIERWKREPGPLDAGLAEPLCIDPVLDHAAFGADRSRLLEVLASFGGASLGDAYAMGRPGSQTDYFGPCVSRTPEAARALLAWFVNQRPARPVFWDFLPAHQQAKALAESTGFRCVRKLTRMVLRGTGDVPPLENDDSLVYGIAGFEYG